MNNISKTLMANIAFALSFAWVSCKDKPENTAAADSKSYISDSFFRTLKLDTVKEQNVVDAITLTGSVDFDQDHVARIYPIVTGILQHFKVNLGDYVQSGQFLGNIKSVEVANMNGDLVGARNSLTLAKKTLQTQKDMYKSGLISIQDLQQAESNYADALNAVEKSNSILNITSSTKNSSELKSPISGFVVEKNTTDNMLVRSDNDAPIVTISDLKKVWVMANLYESNLSKVRVGDRVEVSTLAYPDKTYSGTVNEIMNVLDPVSKVLKLKIVLENPGYMLKPQMFANVRVIQQEGQQAMAISSHSLVFDDSQYYVLVYKSRKDIEIRPVTISSTVGDTVYISSGVQPGEVLINSQALLIYQELNS